MKPREIIEDVYWVGAVDWDRRLFDALIPLPQGTSYNSYLVRGSDKIALIDTVDPSMADVLLGHLAQLGNPKIDYIVANHAEQDHSGSLPEVLELYPEAKVVCTTKCKPLLIDLLGISEERFQAIEDRQVLTLGNKSLQFIYTPWVHWPETMVTYLQEDKILFSCDFFGAHLASSELFVKDKAEVYAAAKRYFAEIMMPFNAPIQKNIEKLRDIEFAMVAPSHGQVYAEPEFIIEAYRDWVYGSPKNLVVLPYVSMHGSTKAMVNHFVGALIDRGVEVKRFDLTAVDLGELGSALVDAATIVLGAPTVLTGAHPLALYAAHLVNSLRPKAKFISVVGSHGWATKAVEQIGGIISSVKAEVLEPVITKGFPKQGDFELLDRLADQIAERHRELKL
ncbi:MAG: FprA family A-type flavoprotein [Firmicutes bacterium]|nr:FprA family A-type flavoprotein [Bacillota bacterium]